VLHSVRAEKFPQRIQPLPVDKDHGLTQIPHTGVFDEARVMVGLPVGRDRVTEDEPTDASALQRVSRVHVPRDDESGESPTRFSTGSADRSLRHHFTQLSKNAAEPQPFLGRGP